jgi:hypothetical protein
VQQEGRSTFDSTTPVSPIAKETVGREGLSQCCLATGNDSFAGPEFVCVVKNGVPLRSPVMLRGDSAKSRSASRQRPGTVGMYGTPGTTRTCNLRIRSPLLYPVELRGQDTRIPTALGFVERVTGIEPA